MKPALALNANRGMACLLALLLTAAQPERARAQAATPPEAATTVTTAAEIFRLGAGDVLSVTVWKQPDLSMQLPVLPDGTLRYPLVGELAVQGRSLAEVEQELTTKMRAQLRAAVVSVTVVQAKSFRLYVLGEVLRPGEFILRAPLTLVQALATAGGLTPFARHDAIIIVRHTKSGEVREIFDYDAYLRGDTPRDPWLKPGDTVIVR